MLKMQAKAWSLTMIFAGVIATAQVSPAHAQIFANYQCEDGSRFSAMFVEGARAVYLHLDGKSLTLPQRLSASGARYRKSGITFWIKGDEAQLKRPQHDWTNCKVF